MRIGDHGRIDQGWGTLLRPKPLELPWCQPVEITAELGYSGRPSTDVWSIELPQPFQLQVSRDTSDPFHIHLHVGLTGPCGRHQAVLVASPTGRGEAVEVPAGRWLVVVSSGKAIEIRCPIRLVALPLQGRLSASSVVRIGSHA